jgi:hypothetical protein
MPSHELTDSSGCIPLESLDEALALPEGDPRRAHLASCPRCRALVDNYRLFTAPDDEDATHALAAEGRLDAYREQWLGRASTAVAPARRGARPGWRSLFAPTLRPAWAAAAVVVVAGAVLLWPRLAPERGRIVLRGSEREPLALAQPEFLASGAVRIAWQPVADADSYQVRFYSTGFAELARLPKVSATHVEAPADRLPADYRQGGLVLVRVVAFKGPDEIAHSRAEGLRRR